MTSQERSELEAIAKKLRSLQEHAREILDLIPDHTGSMSPQQKSEARRLLKEFKDRLAKEASGTFTGLESKWYERTVRSVKAKLTVRVTSLRTHEWLNQVFEAKSGLSKALCDIECALQKDR